MLSSRPPNIRIFLLGPYLLRVSQFLPVTQTWIA